jgi:uncharacterized protein (DUF1330 family)
MAAYVIVDILVEDPETYEVYKGSVAPSLEKYGARFVARGGRAENLEGDWQPGRVVILEFESLERAKEWWASEEYREPKAMRQSASTGRMIVVEGM